MYRIDEQRIAGEMAWSGCRRAAELGVRPDTVVACDLKDAGGGVEHAAAGQAGVAGAAYRCCAAPCACFGCVALDTHRACCITCRCRLRAIRVTRANTSGPLSAFRTAAIDLQRVARAEPRVDPLTGPHRPRGREVEGGPRAAGAWADYRHGYLLLETVRARWPSRRHRRRRRSRGSARTAPVRASTDRSP